MGQRETRTLIIMHRVAVHMARREPCECVRGQYRNYDFYDSLAFMRCPFLISKTQLRLWNLFCTEKNTWKLFYLCNKSLSRGKKFCISNKSQVFFSRSVHRKEKDRRNRKYLFSAYLFMLLITCLLIRNIFQIIKLTFSWNFSFSQKLRFPLFK